MKSNTNSNDADQKRSYTKIISYLPQSDYFPLFFEDRKKLNIYQKGRYTNIIQNYQNNKKNIDSEFQLIKSELEEIIQLYQKHEIEIPALIQKQISDFKHLFSHKSPRSIRSLKFTPFFTNNQKNRKIPEKGTKYILSSYFDIKAANNINNAQFEKLSDWKPEMRRSSTTKLAKEGIYIPPSFNLNIGNLILQAFVDIHEPKCIKNKDTSNNTNCISNAKKKSESNKKKKNSYKRKENKTNTIVKNAESGIDNSSKDKNNDNNNFNILTDQINNEDQNSDKIDNQITSDKNKEETFHFEIPLIDETSPNKYYMDSSFESKLALELESLGFLVPTNQNILMANAFLVSNDIDPNEINQSIEKANKAKNFLSDFTIEHTRDIEEHNQRVSMIDFFAQSIRP